MNKAVLISIQPYYVFLIIARLMGWPIPQYKEVEVRKDFPKDRAWNRTVHIYCSKDRRSFNRIPAQYQPFMAKLLGKVIGEFVCDSIDEFKVFENGTVQYWNYHSLENSCLTYEQIAEYIGKNKMGYGWHISDLKIYDTPKELKEFYTKCGDGNKRYCRRCIYWKQYSYWEPPYCDVDATIPLTRPPQSWQYVEGL